MEGGLMLTQVSVERGHIEFEEGHVHHLPITAVWNAVCNACPGDVQFAPSGRASKTTRRDGIAWLEQHVATCPNKQRGT
jgi:hypothetical protein